MANIVVSVNGKKTVKKISVLYSEVLICLTDGAKIIVRAVNGSDGPEVEVDYEDSEVKIVNIK